MNGDLNVDVDFLMDLEWSVGDSPISKLEILLEISSFTLERKGDGVSDVISFGELHRCFSMVLVIAFR